MARAVRDHNKNKLLRPWAVPDLPRGYRLLPVGSVKPDPYLVFDLDYPDQGWEAGTRQWDPYDVDHLEDQGFVVAIRDDQDGQGVTPLSLFEENLLARVEKVVSGDTQIFDHLDLTVVLDLHSRGFLTVVEDGRRLWATFTDKGKEALEVPRA